MIKHLGKRVLPERWETIGPNVYIDGFSQIQMFGAGTSVTHEIGYYIVIECPEGYVLQGEQCILEEEVVEEEPEQSDDEPCKAIGGGSVGVSPLSNLTASSGNRGNFFIKYEAEDDQWQSEPNIHAGLSQNNLGNFIYTRPDGFVEGYDSDGYLQTITSPGGLKHNYSYNNDNLLTSITDSLW